MMIAVVGAVSSDRVMAKLAETFGKWQRKDAPLVWEVPEPPQFSGVLRQEINIPNKSQADLVLGVIGLKRSAPDYYAASMANLILGRLGLMGRLGENVRDVQGLAYYVGSSLRSGLGAHPWSISAGVRPDDLERATEAILEQVARMRQELISDEELADCQSYLTGALPLRLETNDGIVAHLLNIEQYDLGLGYLAHYGDIVCAVTSKDIQNAVRRYWEPEHYAMAWAGTLR